MPTTTAGSCYGSTPIVMVTSGYPVEPGLAVSLARPGGNVTGNSSYAGGEVFAKHLSLIREVKPTSRRMGVLWDYAPSAFEPRDGEQPLLVDNPTRAFVFG